MMFIKFRKPKLCTKMTIGAATIFQMATSKLLL